MRTTKLDRTVVAAVAGAAVAAMTVAGTVMPADAADKPDARAAGPKPVEVQLLALNDFHGNLEAPTGSSGRIQTGVNPDGTAVNVNAGGAEYLATALAELAEQQKKPNTITVAA